MRLLTLGLLFLYAAKLCLYYHSAKPKQQYFQYLTLINKWGGKKRVSDRLKANNIGKEARRTFAINEDYNKVVIFIIRE